MDEKCFYVDITVPVSGTSLTFTAQLQQQSYCQKSNKYIFKTGYAGCLYEHCSENKTHLMADICKATVRGTFFYNKACYLISYDSQQNKHKLTKTPRHDFNNSTDCGTICTGCISDVAYRNEDFQGGKEHLALVVLDQPYSKLFNNDKSRIQHYLNFFGWLLSVLRYHDIHKFRG